MPNFPALEFDHGETISMLRASVRQFAADEIAPRAADIDRSNQFPADLWRKLGDLGVARHHRRGGVRRHRRWATSRTSSRWRRSAARRHRSGLSYGAHSNLCVNQIRRNGSAAQKVKYLPRLVSGEHVGALAMSEPGAGSDVVSMELRARAQGRPLRAERQQDVDHQRAATPTRSSSTPRPTPMPARAA